MNNYPEWWNETITVYNKHINPVTDMVTWYRTVIPDCFWKEAGVKVLVGSTVIDTNSVICRIRVNEKFMDIMAWKDALPEDLETHFTLQPGDIIVKGEVTDTIDEYTAGQRASDLMEKYVNCLMIDMATVNVGGGRGDEHYLVKFDTKAKKL